METAKVITHNAATDDNGVPESSVLPTAGLTEAKTSSQIGAVPSMRLMHRGFMTDVPEQLQLLPALGPELVQSAAKQDEPNSIGTSQHIGKRTASIELNTTMKKRKHGPKTPKQLVRGGWDDLPHNLGKVWTPSIPVTRDSSVKTFDLEISGETTVNTKFDVNSEAGPQGVEASRNTAGYLSRSRPRRPLSHAIADVEIGSNSSSDAAPYKSVPIKEAASNQKHTHDNLLKKPQRYSNRNVTPIDGLKHSPGLADGEQTGQPKRKAWKTKDNPYGLSPGETPYPGWSAPSPQQCQDVYDILAKMHDDVTPLPPDKIPAPSLEVTGCGEVPSVLDGLIRTVLSGATTFESADGMLQAVVRKFGVLEDGIGKGSVDWNNVRIADYNDVYTQLKNGGLGRIKAKNVQAILNMVYEENMERRAAYLQEKETGSQADVASASDNTTGQKELEILKASEEMLSLDHMHSMETHNAIGHFVRYPGVGVKTAACVTLFSLQRPCFAVDTHVFRMSRWLGWVPEKTSEDETFGHLEVRCPDRLKYGLHQLFVRHGKTCHRCNDKSFQATKAWDETQCPLEHLMNRFTKRAAKTRSSKEGQ